MGSPCCCDAVCPLEERDEAMCARVGCGERGCEVEDAEGGRE